MDGIRRREVIQSWVDSTIKNGGIDRFDDLHVDEIDDAWKPQKKWIAAAVESFEIAVEARNLHGKGLDLQILLSIPLASGTNPMGVTFHSRSALEGSMSYTPPSLYLLRSDNKIIREAKAAKNSGAGWKGNLKLLMGSELFGKMRAPNDCIYSESKRPDEDEYARYLYLLG